MRFLRPAISVALLGLMLALCLACSSDQRAEEEYSHSTHPEKARLAQTLTFNGGPAGGTFNYFANKMSTMIANEVNWLEIRPKESGGSLDNICALNLSLADMAIIYSGDAFLGRNGRLDCEDARRDKVRALAYLYGAPAQLVVRQDSGISSIQDLKGKVIAIGNPGSGAALAAERFFKHLGLWDSIELRTLGYSVAASYMAEGQLDGFWVLVGYPNASVIEAGTRMPIKLISLHQTALRSGFYDLYPFYTRTKIPAWTYEGQPEPIDTFQDSALWCARMNLDNEAVYQSLRTVFSEKGLEEMRKAHKAAREMAMDQDSSHISIPLHPGAVRFWADNNMDIPTILLP